jgi:hypothetical protein
MGTLAHPGWSFVPWHDVEGSQPEKIASQTPIDVYSGESAAMKVRIRNLHEGVVGTSKYDNSQDY